MAKPAWFQPPFNTTNIQHREKKLTKKKRHNLNVSFDPPKSNQGHKVERAQEKKKTQRNMALHIQKEKTTVYSHSSLSTAA